MMCGGFTVRFNPRMPFTAPIRPYTRISADDGYPPRGPTSVAAPVTPVGGQWVEE